MVMKAVSLFVSVFFLMLFWAVPAPCAEKDHAFDGSKSFSEGWRTLLLPERDIVSYPNKVIKLIGIRPGDVVVDVDPGPGYWTFKLAKAVGPSGKALGVQVCELDCKEMNEWVAATVSDRKINPYNNVEFRKGQAHNIDLPADSVDVVFISLCAVLLKNRDMICSDGRPLSENRDFQGQEELLRSIHTALKPGGKLVVIDLLDTAAVEPYLSNIDPNYKKDPVFAIVADGVDDVISNYKRIGFKVVAEYPIFKGTAYLKDVEKVRKSKNFKGLFWRYKPTFDSEKFFLVFEKFPEGEAPQK